MTESYLEHLNPEQRRAVVHFEGPILVLAGAGSGKTRVLTARIAHLVDHHGVAPERILAVTFTNKAAGEMRERIGDLLGSTPRGMWIGTFHALGARILRRHAPRLGWSRSFTIVDQEQSLKLIKKTSEAVGIDSKRWKPKAVRGHISGAKNQLISAAEFVEDNEGSFDLFARNVAKVYPAYQTALKEQNGFDFDDLLVKPVELFESAPDLLASFRERFSFVLVDEYQDTNRAQFRFLELLAHEHENLMVVGDDDQSIYGWRGADIRNILGFEKRFDGAAVVRLEQNYRSSATILAAANAVIAQNVQRKGKTLRTDRSRGDQITIATTLDERDEARWILDQIERRCQQDIGFTYRDVAILYRTNAQARPMEDAFRRAGVPYQIVGGVRFYERREIQDILAYLRLIGNPLDGGAFDRIVNYPRRGIGSTGQERLSRWAQSQGISLLEAAARSEEAQDIPQGARRSLTEFARLIQRYSGLAADMKVGDLLQDLVEELGILGHLQDEGPEGEDRADNVRELIDGAHDYNVERLSDLEPDEVDPFSELDLYLQQVALVADVDRLDPQADTVTLMTLHNAKGLEFPVVFVAGLEDGLFPLGRSYDDPAALEEERRLLYVGITRAQDTLFLTHAKQRRRAGEMMFGRLSPFVDAIPEDLIDRRRSAMVSATPRYARRRPERKETEYRDGFTSTGDLYDAGPDLDASMDQDLPRFADGERVLHDKFGSGTITEVAGFGRDLKVTVDFDTIGEKKLLVRYAGLKRDYD